MQNNRRQISNYFWFTGSMKNSRYSMLHLKKLCESELLCFYSKIYMLLTLAQSMESSSFSRRAMKCERFYIKFCSWRNFVCCWRFISMSSIYRLKINDKMTARLFYVTFFLEMMLWKNMKSSPIWEIFWNIRSKCMVKALCVNLLSW